MTESPGVDPGSLLPPDRLAYYAVGSPPLDRAALDSWLTRGSSVANGFRLDADAAQECVRRMRRTVTDLRDLELDLMPNRVLPIPRDLVSRNFVENCAAALHEASNYFTAWRQQLEDAIDALEGQIKSYGVVEQENRTNMT